RPTRPGSRASYTVTDRVALGPLRLPVSYRADVLTASTEEVVVVARQWSGTRVRNHARIRPEGPDQVRIDVEITLAAPAPLLGYALRQARAAHLTLAARLGAALDSV
ncbi:SRPBCC family protein, partial [Micromonospora echinofusca]